MKPVLRHITDGAVGDVHLLSEFVQEIGASVSSKIPTKRPDDFTDADNEELRKFGEFLTLGETAASKKGAKRGEPVFQTKISHRVGSYIMQVAIPIKQQTFLAEMSLVYLVARLEAFLKDYAREVLLLKPAMLKSSSTLTTEEVLSHGSMRALREALAEREVAQLSSGGLDGAATFFQKRMNISLSSYSSWDALREHAYRRNLIVHSAAKVDATYMKKVGKTVRSDDVSTDSLYVRDAASNIKAFMKYVHSSVLAKFGAHEV
jgi:hypothetical protein